MKLSQILAEAKQVCESTGNVEIADLVANFPSTYKAALGKLWGGDRLTYKGQQLFKDGDLGPAYEGAIDAAEKELKSKYSIIFNFDDMTTEQEVVFSDQQEVYLGFDKRANQLYIGFDAWIADDDLNEVFDKMYAEQYGEDVDDVEEYQEMRAGFIEQAKSGFRGLLFELQGDGRRFTADLIQDAPGGFYKGIYKSAEFKRAGLVDLRLD